MKMRNENEVLWLVFKLMLAGLFFAVAGIKFGEGLDFSHMRQLSMLAMAIGFGIHLLPPRPRWLGLLGLAAGSFVSGMAAAPIINLLVDMFGDGLLLGITAACWGLVGLCLYLSRGRSIHWIVPKILAGAHGFWATWLISNGGNPLQSIPWGVMGIVVAMSFFVERFCFLRRNRVDDGPKGIPWIGRPTVEQRHGWISTVSLADDLVGCFLHLFQSALILALIIILKFYRQVSRGLQRQLR